ncbi:fascin domain-containing protein [Micromonospora zamorensis]|uniref:fascin domain-containing protein n=1 Tax=Micromonospora zamorensis TaxID=709883 RepID=UPI0034007F87
MLKRKFARLPVALFAVLAIVGAQTPALAHDVRTKAASCWFHLMSGANAKYVSARGNLAGYPLQANTEYPPGTWESFCLESQGYDVFAIWSRTTGKYVSVRANVTNYPLRANADFVGPWERFTIQYSGDGTTSYLSLATGKFVSAKMNLSNYPLQANADEIGTWEKFWTADE